MSPMYLLQKYNFIFSSMKIFGLIKKYTNAHICIIFITFKFFISLVFKIIKESIFF